MSGLFIGHNTFRSRKDGDSESIEDTRHVFVAAVVTQSGTRNALKAFDGIDFVNRIVFEGNFDCSSGGFTLYKLVVKNIAFFKKDFCDFLGYTETEFWNIVDGFYNTDIFKKDEFGEWVLKEQVH